MERNIKRFLSLVLAFVMVFGMFPANVFATGADATVTDPDDEIVVNEEPIAEDGNVAKIGDTEYATLAAAIAAASAGSTITLIGDVTEDVTVNKDLTIDGAGKNYTGNIAVKGSTVDIVVKNVNFVNGTGYAITTNTIKSVTVEDCTVKDYGYGFLYANKATTTIMIKNVTVDGCNYGMHWVYGFTATLENVNMTNVANGIMVQNYAKKTVNLENCTILAEEPIYIWERSGYSAVQTINIGQGNNFGGADMDFGAYAKVVGAEVLCDNVIYASYGEAYAAAENGSVLKLVADLDVDAPIVIEKNISLDLNGKTITGLENVYPVVRIQNDANVTVLDSKSDADVAALDSENEGGSIVNETDYIFVLGASDGSSKGNLTIENGTFKGATTVASVTKGELIVKGGSFEVVDDATYLLNCIDANYRDGSAKISVQGGTFKDFDPMNNAAEGAGTNFCAVGYESVDNGDGTWTVKKPAYVAQIGAQGYTSLSAAIAAAVSGNTITLLADITEDVTVNKSVTIDGAEKTYTGKMNLTSGTITIKNVNFDGKGYNGYAVETHGASSLTVENCSAQNYGYGFVQIVKSCKLAAKDVTVQNVNYGFKVDRSAGVTMENVSVVANKEGIYDSNYGAKTYTIKNSSFSSIEIWERNDTITTTFNFEGANTVGDLDNSEFAKYVLVEETATLTAPAGNTVTTTVADLEVIHDGEKYLVADVVYVAEINGVQYETLAAAIAAVKNGETIKLLTDITEDVTITQTAGLSFTIDGNNNVYSGTVTINGNKRYTGAEKLTFQNVKFATEETAHTFVYSGSKDTCQAHNVTFVGCSFTGPEGVNNVMGMYARQSNGITFTGCVAENVMYLFQSNSAGINLTVEDCVIDATYGIRVHNGDNAVIRNVELNTSTSGIIFDGGQTRTATLENVTITGEGTPIYLNNATAGTQKLVMKGTNNIDGNWFKISGTGATIVVDLTDDANLDIAKVTYDKSYYIIESEEKVHTFTKFTAVAQIGEQGYATLADAIAAAVSGDTIVLLADITEDVTVNKSVTIDGANFSYTGKMDVTGTASITLQNLNFVAGCVDKASGNGSVTVMNCNFDGQGLNCYALNLRTGSKNIVIENVTAKGYGYGFLQTPRTSGKISVKDVEITDVNYGFKIDYGTGVTMEGVSVDARIEGIWASNYGSKTYTITNSDFTSIEVLERTNATGINTFNLEGANTASALDASEYAKYVLVEENATLTAPAGNTVTTSVADRKVIHDGDKYLVASLVYVAQVGENKYESIQAAVDAAVNGDTVKLLMDIALDNDDVIALSDNNITCMVNVTGKNITLDMAGYTIDIDYTSTSDALFTAVYVADGAGLTVTGDGAIDLYQEGVVGDYENVYYMFWKRGTTGYLTIENGSYHANNLEDSMVYTNGNRIVTIEGGTFILDSTGSGENGSPWIFNAKGQNDNSIVVTGGIYNVDVSNQHYVGEVYIPDGYICEQIADDRWEVHAGSWVAEIQDAEGNRVKAYKTFQEAIDAVANGQTIVLLADCDEDVTIAQTAGKSIVVDGDGKNYTGTITVDGKNGSTRSETLTFRNVNFQVDGVAIDTKKGSLVHNITVEGCTFTGDGQNYDYGIYLRNAYNITVKDTSGTGLFDLVYGNSAVTGFTAESVTVMDSYNGIWLSYVNSTADFKNVTTDVENAGVGFYTYVSGTATFEGCEIDKVVYNNTKGSGSMKLVFNDAENNLAIGGNGERLTAVLNQVDATLTAEEGLTVIANEELAKTYEVVYENGVYRLSHAIARNEKTGKLYMDLSDGLDEAKKNQTVTLLAETSEDLVLVPAGVTFDLNGHVVTAKNALSFGVVMDTAETVGGIKIYSDTTKAFTKLQPENGGYLPIYDIREGEEIGTYKFFKYELVNKGAKPNGSAAVKFGFAVNFDNEAAYTVLAETEDSGITLTANVSWTNMTVPTIEYQFTCAQIKEYAASKAVAPTKTYVIFLSIGGLNNLAPGDYISAAPVLTTITEVGRTNDAYVYTIG